MSCITSTERARIVTAITTKETQLAAVNAAYLESLTNAEIQTFTFDSGEGKQSTTRRKPGELADAINRLESEINRLRRRLTGGGIVNMNLRRRS
jgi:hypothetical protein